MRSFLTVTAALLGIALALYPLTVASPITPLMVVAGAALALLGLALITSSWLFAGPCVALLVVEYASALALAPRRVDLLSAAVAAGYLLLLELLDAVRALVRQAPMQRAVLKRMGSDSVPAVVTGGIGALGAVLASTIVRGSHPVLLAIGAAGGLAGVAFAVALARKALSPS